ncbi:MAG: HEAT repeat domain-containing protein [Anaerolineaceae bacterium]|nr:HEAT repeat domain-containing protein [Anaerolineaceae bacterium]
MKRKTVKVFPLMDSQANPEEHQYNEIASPGGEQTQILAKILEKGDWVMRLRAAGALIDMQDQRGWLFLEHALRHPKKDIRGAAIELLAERGGEGAVNLLKHSLKDESKEIRLLAAETISGLLKDAERDDPGLQEEVQTILQDTPPARTPNSPEVEKKLIRMDFAFGLLGGTATLLALGVLFLGIAAFRLPFILLAIVATAAFIGNRGMERRDRKGYLLAVAGSLFLLPGVPLFTIPGLVFLFHLLRPEFTQAFELTATDEKNQ